MFFTKWESQGHLSGLLSVVSPLYLTFCSWFLLVGWLLLFGGSVYSFVWLRISLYDPTGVVLTLKEPGLGRAVIPQPLLLKYISHRRSNSPEPSKLTPLCLNKGRCEAPIPTLPHPQPQLCLIF